MRNKFCIGLVFMILVGCKKTPPEPSALYEKYRNSVVLIRSSNYFKATLENDWDFYYTFNNGEIILYEDESEASLNSNSGFGTGFIIDNKGKIVTNRHVVIPEDYRDLATEKIYDYIELIKSRINSSIKEKGEEKSDIADYHNDYYDQLTDSKLSKLKGEYESLDNEIQELKELYETIDLDININSISFEIVSNGLGVVFDNTFVESVDDYHGCVIIDLSENPDIDLAIIQLKTKRTPDYITDYFNLNKLNKNNNVAMSDDVYMIGYNHGFSLANTEDGIKSQFTHGTITQEPDNKKIMYSTPTLPGSSGSPIINEWGDLIAINYAKTSDFQGFSFGVPVSNLLKLYYKKDYFKDELFTNDRIESSIYSNEIDFEDKIKSLLIAEENRNFDKIYSFFSPNVKRYWDMDNPNYDKVKERYEYIWGFTSNSKNYIKKIIKIADYTYDLYTEFEYYNQRKKKTISISSRVRYIFDTNGKVIETYGID